MPLYMLVQITNGHKENIGLFDSHAKAMSAQTSITMKEFDSGNLCGISFKIEEHFVK